MSPTYRVRAAGPDDLDFMATQQIAHLSHGFFPRLGPTFIRRWHASYLDDPRAVALIAEEGDEDPGHPVGYLLGSTDHAEFVQASIARHRRRLLTAGVLALARRPGLLLHFLKTRVLHYVRRLLAYRSRASSSSGASADRRPAVAVISAVVVDEAHRGRRVGYDLTTAFLARAREAGTCSAELVTTADGGAGPFYRRLGWREAGRRADRSGVEILTFGLDLTRAAPTGEQDGARDQPHPGMRAQPSTRAGHHGGDTSAQQHSDDARGEEGR